MNNEESIYVNIDLNELVIFLKECGISEEKIELIVNYCMKRREEQLRDSNNSKSYGL